MLPEYVKKAINILKNNGFEAYAVGGCVRDMLLLRNANDYDVTTSAMPEEIKMCFKDFRCIETGIKHGTVSVIVDGEIIEITTYRIDGEYEDNRHPTSVQFVDKVELDLSWSNENGGDYGGPRDIDEEKREATHVSIDFIVNGDRYRGVFDEL